MSLRGRCGRIAGGCALAVAIACSIACSACRAKKNPSERKTLPETTLEIPPGRLPQPWSWSDTTAADYALPVGCKLVSRPWRSPVDTARLLFLAAAGDAQTLAVVTGSDEGDITATRAILTLLPDKAQSPVRDVPWTHMTAPPIMASAGGKWLAVLTQADLFGPRTRLWLWREGKQMEALGEGDQLAAVDARCAGSTCALLTTRVSEVAAPGATLWRGSFEQPVASWTRHDVVPVDAKVAKPLSVSGYDPMNGRATIAFDLGETVAFFAGDGAQLQPVGTVPRLDGVLDTTTTAAGPVAMTIAGRLQPNGCAASGATLHVSAPGREPQKVDLSALPDSGYARQLGGGALVTWISPVTCQNPDRKVVKAVLVTREGRLAGNVMTIGDADGHAVAASGDDAVIWLRGADGVTVLRAKCDVSPRARAE